MRAWLWPDHVIGKRESRRLREEHNRIYNERWELLQALKGLQKELRESGVFSKLSVRKREHFALLAADAQAGTAVFNAEKGEV